MLNKIILIILVLFIIPNVMANEQVLYHKYNEDTNYALDYTGKGNNGIIYNDDLINGIEKTACNFNGGNEINIVEVYDSTEPGIYISTTFNDYLYIGTHNDALILRSSDGITWTEVYNHPTESYIYALGTFNNYIYAGTGANGKILRSSDGTTWNEVYDSPTESYISGLVEFDGYIYVGTYINGLILRSSDGTTWNEVYDSPTEETFVSFTVFKNYLYAGSSPNGLILRSSDGTTWNEIYDSPTETIMRGLTVLNNYIYVGTTGNGLILRSSDGTTWNEVYDSPTEIGIQNLYVLNNYIYGGTDTGGLILRSYDGVTWSIIKDTTETYIYTINSLNSYVYFGTYGNGLILRQDTSKDTYIEIQDDNTLSFCDTDDLPLSCCFWVKFEEYLENTILEKGVYTDDVSSTAEYTIKISHVGNKGSFYLNDYDAGFIECTSVNDLTNFDTKNGWLHIFFTYDGSETYQGMKMYVNGKLIDTVNSKTGVYNGMENLNGNLYIGVSSYLGETHYLDGALDELILFDYCLSSGQVELLYNDYLGNYTVMLLSKEVYNIDDSISVFKGEHFEGTYTYGETIVIEDLYNYTFILHEDIIDDITNIDNLPDHVKNNSSIITYIIIVFTFLGLLWFIFRRIYK